MFDLNYSIYYFIFPSLTVLLDQVLLCVQADVNYQAQLQQHYWGDDKGGKQEHRSIFKDCWKTDAYIKLSILSLI